LAVNKRKILESARKLVQKGSKEKALAEYQKLLKLDPRDAKLRLEIGDAHRRWGQVDKAVETYTRVADQYMAEGFDARAVAVFKQIVNLDPDRFDAYGPLAELYERMGLTAEAIGALQTAADGFHRQGKKDEALDLLRKMANVDPSNTTSRIKVADLLRQQEKNEDAITEYQLAVAELERQGDSETVGTVLRRILEVDETHVPALSALAQNLAARGKVAEAVPLAERAVQLDGANPEHYELLADLFQRTQRPSDREKTLRGMAEVYRQRGDEDRARDILQRCVSSPALQGEADPDEPSDGAPGEDGAFFDTEFPDTEESPELSFDFGNDGGIDHDASALGDSQPIGASVPMAADDDAEELLLEEVAVEPAPPAPSDVSIDIDVDQLLAEATVYLRYGKREKAIAHLERVVEAQPEHRGALEKLGEAFAEDGQNPRAVDLWIRAANAAHAEGDEDALRVLSGRVAVLDEAAAKQIPGISSADSDGDADAAGPPPSDDLEFDVGDDDELLLDDDELLDDIASNDAVDASSEEIQADLSDEEESEIEVDTDLDYEDLVGDESPDLGDADSAPDPDEDASEAIPMSTVASLSSGDASLSVDAKQQVLDDLDEADFYMQQGLHDEASSIYQRVLAVAPNHPRAMLRLGEIAAARGESMVSSKASAPPDETPVPDVDLEEEDQLAAAASDESDAPLEIEPPENEAPPMDDLDDLSDLDLGDVETTDAGSVPEDDDGEDLEADEADEADETDETDEAATDASDTQELRPNPAASQPPAPDAGISVAPEIEGAEGDFDLAAALSDAFDDDPGASQSGISAGTDDGFEAVFDAFKKGVSETLEEGDHQAHYDLAIAYKEMGLLDDAINELRTAMADPGRTAECLHLIGLCAIDADQAPLAIEHLEQLLTLPDLDPKAAVAARFDLGRALESVGDIDGARREWESVMASDASFQNVSEHLAGLGEAKAESDDQGDDQDGGFESFDDVMDGIDEASDDAEAEVTASDGESFDDLMAEMSDEEPAIDSEAILEAEPVEEPEPEPPGAAARKRPKPAAKRKKKKISFL
jgi:tetratricopeptide (TPR) repeat protein